MIINLYRYKGYIWRNALLELRQRYAGAGLGILWHVVYPLSQIAVFSVVFSQIMRARLPSMGGSELSFTLYLCAGLFPWMGLSEIITRSTSSLIANASYITKLAMPEQVFFARDALTGSLTMLFNVIILMVAALALGLPAAASWWLLPIVLLLLATFGFGLGMCLGVLNVFFKDIGQLLNIVLQLWMWLTPIVYAESIVPAGFRPLLAFNPAYYYITSVHKTLLFGASPEMFSWVCMGLGAVAAPTLGYVLLRSMRVELRDNL